MPDHPLTLSSWNRRNNDARNSTIEIRPGLRQQLCDAMDAVARSRGPSCIEFRWHDVKRRWEMMWKALKESMGKDFPYREPTGEAMMPSRQTILDFRKHPAKRRERHTLDLLCLLFLGRNYEELEGSTMYVPDSPPVRNGRLGVLQVHSSMWGLEQALRKGTTSATLPEQVVAIHDPVPYAWQGPCDVHRALAAGASVRLLLPDPRLDGIQHFVDFNRLSTQEFFAVPHPDRDAVLAAIVWTANLVCNVLGDIWGESDRLEVRVGNVLPMPPGCYIDMEGVKGRCFLRSPILGLPPRETPILECASEPEGYARLCWQGFRQVWERATSLEMYLYREGDDLWIGRRHEWNMLSYVWGLFPSWNGDPVLSEEMEHIRKEHAAMKEQRSMEHFFECINAAQQRLRPPNGDGGKGYLP